MIIDSHIHLYPPSVYENLQKWGSENSENYWLSCVAPPRGRSLQGWATVSKLLADMDAAEVEKVVILAWYWENHDTCEQNLNWQIEWTSAHPDRFIAFAPFNANGGQRAIDLLKRAFDAGFRGIGELNPPAQGYGYDDPFLQKAVELAAQANAPVNLHVTDPATREYPGKIATPFAKLYALADSHPNTKFVFSHLGGLAPLLDGFPNKGNVWYDTAACPLLYGLEVYREFCDKVGADRILFGSDYPLRVFPRAIESPDFVTPLQQLRSAGLSDQEFLKIVSSNAIRLLNHK